ncbi:uncharacterized protein F4822DRAFT_252086 [Hypoxylon trugodes]|uniref:uncharacterized protein n=1 Tax=Hypoxylon trugodes TaxID=326681 RepID=UPI002194B893|nr:uncharacterized protein F4822DRAFT_252086 [Hypoxylon trugodes]KAI1388636.1 hypothetical protein F4822DRAFT_252086 [Hypoxylon trugodes]
MVSPMLSFLEFSVSQLVLLTILCIGAYAWLFQYVTRRREKRENLDKITVFADYNQVYLDIVAVHGLGAHPYHSWKTSGAPPDSDSDLNSSRAIKRGATAINWLEHEDFLKKDFKNARILSFGYNADWFMDASLSTAPQKAVMLLKTLSEFRQTSGKTPPILFIGHSFGGILVKYAIHAAHSDPRFEEINRNTAGVIFLGTPHQGSTVSLIGEILARLTPFLGSDTTLIKFLSHRSSALLDLKRDFSATMTSIMTQRPLPVYSFYETLPTFRYGVSLGVIVGPESATLDIGEHIPINTDHSGLNKCRTREDELYRKIRGAIQGVQNTLREQLDPIAKWIMASNNPAHVYKYRLDHERAREKLSSYPELGKWLIESPAFSKWGEFSQTSFPTFCLRGAVGTGKTSLRSRRMVLQARSS